MSNIKNKLIGNVETTDIISVNSYFGSMLIGTIPIYGDIMLNKWSKSTDVRENKRNMCKAYLKLKIVLIYPAFIALITMGVISINVVVSWLK